MTSTTQDSTYHSSTSQYNFGYKTPHVLSHFVPVANTGDRLPYENRYEDFSNSQTNHPFLLGSPPLPNHGSATSHENLLPPWRYFLDPIVGTEEKKIALGEERLMTAAMAETKKSKVREQALMLMDASILDETSKQYWEQARHEILGAPKQSSTLPRSNVPGNWK